MAILRKGLGETRVLRRGAARPKLSASASNQPLAGYVTELLDSAERGDRSDVAAALADWAEREIYRQAIRLSNWDQTQAAKWLGVSRPTIREKLSRYNLRAEEHDGQKDHEEQLA
jgi:DNA-binding NtrC family response regulator